MKIFGFVAAIIFASNAFAATAYWTGKSEQVQTVTYKWVWRCEYRYLSQTFWRLSESTCPSSIEIQ
jgi:hypothetical protein